MTSDKAFKAAVRELAAAQNLPYSEARRRLLAHRAESAESAESAPPVLVPVARQICPEGCDGSGHPGAVCREWTPFEDQEFGHSCRLDIPWTVRLAASLPLRRGEYLHERAGQHRATAHLHQPPFLHALVYDLLATRQPGLAPARAALRTAHKAGDLEAVDELMEPLDRAAANLIPFAASQWWQELQPRLDAHARARLADGPQQVHPLLDEMQIYRAAKLWTRAFTPYRNWNGYQETDGVSWLEAKEELDGILTARCGGRAKGGKALLDGCQVTILAARWAQTGPPIAYDVRRQTGDLSADVELAAPERLTDLPSPGTAGLSGGAGD